MVIAVRHRCQAQTIAAVNAAKMQRSTNAPPDLIVTEVNMENSWDGSGVPPVGTKIIHSSEMFERKSAGVVIFSREHDFVCDFDGRMAVFMGGDKEVIPFNQSIIDEENIIDEVSGALGVSQWSNRRNIATAIYQAIQSGEITCLKFNK